MSARRWLAAVMGPVLVGVVVSGGCTLMLPFEDPPSEDGQVCGDEEATGTEECDGEDLRGLTCQELGFSGGTPGCNAGCLLDLSLCRTAVQCETGKTDCDGVCVDVTTDPENCGTCGDVCGADERCIQGGCHSSTVLVMHNDGDRSSRQHVISTHNAIFFDGDPHRFGEGALQGYGGSSLALEPHADWAFGAADFTIDFWMTLEDLDRLHNGFFGQDDYQWIAFEYNHDGNRKLSLWIDGTCGPYWDLTLRGLGIKDDWVAGQWYHLAVVRSGGTVTVYVDGQVDFSGTYAGEVCHLDTLPIYIGRSQLADRFHKGALDEFRISDVARWTAPFSPPGEGYEPDGSTLLLLHLEGDASGRMHPVAATDGVRWTAALGRFGGALALDGAGHLTAADHPDWAYGTSDFTLDLWIHPATLGGAVWQQYQDDDNHATLETMADGSVSFQWRQQGSQVAMLSTDPGAVASGRWAHLAVVRSGDAIHLFVDGIALSQASVAGVSYADFQGDITVGAAYAAHTLGSRFRGYIDELRITHAALWSTNFTPPIEPWR